MPAQIQAEKRPEKRLAHREPHTVPAGVCPVIVLRHPDAEVEHLRPVGHRVQDRCRGLAAAGELYWHDRGLRRHTVGVLRGNRSAARDVDLERPTGIVPRSRCNQGDEGAVPFPRLPPVVVLEDTGASIDHAARRPDPARQIGVGGVHAVVGHRDGHALPEIAAFVGLMG